MILCLLFSGFQFIGCIKSNHSSSSRWKKFPYRKDRYPFVDFCSSYLFYSIVLETLGIRFNSCYSTSWTNENETWTSSDRSPQKVLSDFSSPCVHRGGTRAVVGDHLGWPFPSSCFCGHVHNLLRVGRTRHTAPCPDSYESVWLCAAASPITHAIFRCLLELQSIIDANAIIQPP